MLILAEEDRAPQALLAAPPSQLLMGVEEMQRAFWEGTDQGRAMLHQVRGSQGCWQALSNEGCLVYASERSELPAHRGVAVPAM